MAGLILQPLGDGARDGGLASACHTAQLKDGLTVVLQSPVLDLL